MTTLKQRAICGTELSYNTAAGDSTYQAFSGPFTKPPALAIFDNQSDTTVSISQDGTNAWKTFVAGQSLVLDLRANKGDPSQDLVFAEGDQFYGSSAAGTGSFFISYIYAG